MRTAITGTPGVGKTTLAGLLRAEGAQVIDVLDLARRHGAAVGHDAQDDADVIDIEALRGHLPDDCFVDGHLAHLLEVDVAWVIRCDPDRLRQRLEARGYSPAKVKENLEAEAMDLILQEALDQVPRVIQRDGTARDAPALLAAFRQADEGHDIENVDWTDRLPVT